MTFYDIYNQYRNINPDEIAEKTSAREIRDILKKNKIDRMDYLKLLCFKDDSVLEETARRAHELSLMNFGKSVLLYTPLYLSNYCINRCSYCSYNLGNEIERKTLTPEEIRREAEAIHNTGLRHILILTGESRSEAPISYIADAVKILKDYFESIAIEVYPFTEEEYAEIIAAGADSMTIYQEVYNEEIYDEVHLSGPKKKYRFRLDAPERACKQKIRAVNIGALLGLNDCRYESFLTGLHVEYLQDNYPDVELSVSFPRIRPHEGVFEDICDVSDKDLVRLIMATRIFLPRVGITISTREREGFRDNLIPLGVTKISAGVSTQVGGHAIEKKGDSQFEISDKRSVPEIKKALINKGYQPIMKDWMKM